MNSLTIRFTSDERRYLTIYKEIKKQILNGRLRKDERLPSKRALSKSLGVSVNTVLSGYDLLLQEGYLYSREKSGYFVAESYPPSKETTFAEPEEKKYRWDFTSAKVDRSSFPSFTFKKIINHLLMNQPDILMNKAPYQGDLSLRVSLSRYLRENKGIEVDPGRIVIVSSLEESLSIVASLIPLNSLGIENPGYHKILRFFDSECAIDYLDLDEEGAKVPEKDYSLLYLTPYNQFPTGVRMSSRRKKEIAQCACLYLFEDDFDCDLISRKGYVSTIYSLNKEKVFYYGTFTHTIGPGIRIGYLLLPSGMEERYRNRYRYSSSRISALDQGFLSVFLREGYYYRHIGKIKRIHARKKAAIRRILDRCPCISYQENELSFLIRYQGGRSVSSLKEQLEKSGIKIDWICDFQKSPDDFRLILFFSSVPEEQIETALKELTGLLQSSG